MIINNVRRETPDGPIFSLDTITDEIDEIMALLEKNLDFHLHEYELYDVIQKIKER